MAQNFWDIKSCSTMPKKEPNVLLRNNMHTIEIFESTTTKRKNRYSLRLLCKNEVVYLPININMAIIRILSLEKKFEKLPSLKAKYTETTNHKHTLP